MYPSTVDGKWGMWGPWAYCSATCNYGTKLRRRLCDSPPPKGEGEDCEGEDGSEAVCKDRNCGVPGEINNRLTLICYNIFTMRFT